MGELLKTVGLCVVGVGCSYAACKAIDKQETTEFNKNLEKITAVQGITILMTILDDHI